MRFPRARRSTGNEPVPVCMTPQDVFNNLMSLKFLGCNESVPTAMSALRFRGAMREFNRGNLIPAFSTISQRRRRKLGNQSLFTCRSPSSSTGSVPLRIASRVVQTLISGSTPTPMNSVPLLILSCLLQMRAQPPPGSWNETGEPVEPALGIPMSFPRFDIL